MKDYFGAASFLVAGAIVVAASQPVWAQSAAAPATQVTGVQTKLSGGGVQVMLETRDGNRPQVFSTVRGKSWVADVINTQLRLPGTLTFRQDNPAPGIASVEVFPLDANSIRVRVTGQNNSPTGQMDRNDRGLVISLAAPAGSSASAAPAQPSISVTRPTTPNPGPIAQTPAPVPTTPGANPAQPVPANINVAPPFLPRAVAPPVGDIAVSSVDIAPTTIDLGTAERIPRLVLREAPVREVLSLLSRAAGLNIAFSETGSTAAPAPGGAAAPAGAAGATISLDIENEPVQDVFNYVLRLSGLQASRSGRTIFVGRSLPAESRGLIMRTLRLNQLKADLPQVNLTTTSTSASSLTTSAGQGGASTNSTVGRTSNYSQNIPLRGALQILVGLGAEAAGGGAATGAPATLTDVPLRGLTVTADSRTNSITLIGTPRVVDIATSFLTQLDVRKRQVAVNVKIVDINLLNTDSFSSSFSFGIADTFVSVDGGRATTNFGQFRPPNAGQVQTSLLGQTVINNPYSDATTFVTTDGQGDLTFPGGFFQGNSVQTITSNSSAIQRFPASGVTQIPGNPVTFTGRAVPVGSDPFAAGITNITQGTPTTITTTITDVTTTDAFGNTVTRPTTTSTTAVGTPPSATNGLPSLFQFPRQFLLSLQAQVQSGNAKVLTDPTLIVQEGSQSQVNLTQQVFSGFTEQRRTEGNLTTTSILPGAPIDVGVILNIFVDQIDDNGFITLSVAPEVSAPGQSITDPSRNNLIVQQLVNRRRLETGNIRLRDGQTLILTGVIQESDRVITTKTPILGDLPLIGALFRSTSRENSRSEVVVMITPQIMDDSQQSGAGYNYTPSPDVREMLERGRGSR